MKETEYILERVSAVYKELEEAKSREIGELYKKEIATHSSIEKGDKNGIEVQTIGTATS